MAHGFAQSEPPTGHPATVGRRVAGPVRRAAGAGARRASPAGWPRRPSRSLPITLAFPDGTSWGAGGPQLQLVRPDNFFARLGADGLIGFGEAWMTGDLTTGGWHTEQRPRSPGATAAGAGCANEATDELAAALEVLAGRMSVLVPRSLQKLRRAWQSRPRRPRRTPRPAPGRTSTGTTTCPTTCSSCSSTRRLTYSAAWFEPGDDLRAAQQRKIDGILDLARVGPGMHVLEIGSGWGGLAIRAVQSSADAHVTTLTLSEQQKELADRRIAEAGLTDRIEVLLEDYRQPRRARGRDATTPSSASR